MVNIKITGNNISASNVSIVDGAVSTTLTTDKAAGSSSLTVTNIAGFGASTLANGYPYLLIGNLGEATAEIVRIHSATAPTGSTITLNANTVYDHYVDTPVTQIYFDQIEFSRATTLAGSKSVLVTSSISPNRKDTVYTDVTNTTGFAFARLKNSTGSTFSSYSGGVSYSGNDVNSFQSIAEEACQLVSVKVNEEFSSESDLLKDVNEAQMYVSELQPWIFELIKDDTSITTSENENRYALSSLTYAMKFPDTYQGILDIRFGSEPLKYVSPDEMDELLRSAITTTLSAQAGIGDTSITLVDSNEFSSSGSVTLGTNTAISYTTNTKSTGVLSGISASSITAIVSSGASVWQGINPGKPNKYTIFNGYIVLNTPVKTSEAGKKLKIKYLKVLTPLTDYTSETVIPFYNCLKYYVASKIATRKQNFDDAKNLMGTFVEKVTANANVYQLPSMEEMEYYAFPSRRTLGSYYDQATDRLNN